MCDVLLINSPIFSDNRDPDAGSSVPPLGLGYIYTQLLRAGYECQLVNAVVDSLLPKDVIELIDNSDARYIGLNVFSSNIDIVRSIVENIGSSKMILLGGPGIHGLLEEINTWHHNNSIIAIIGESELVLPTIIDNWRSLKYSTKRVIPVEVGVSSPYFPMEIDLPLDRTVFANEPVSRIDLGVVESHILASRGCTYDCSFCSSSRKSKPNTKPRFRSYESLSAEIEYIKKIHPTTDCVRLLDDLFLVARSNIVSAIRLFTANSLKWRSMAHINTFEHLSPGELAGIRQSGCRELFFGVESGSDEILKVMGKTFSVDRAFKTLSKVMDAQIPIKCYFILGFPGETESRLSDTLELATRLHDYAIERGSIFRISPFRFRPYHGTAIYDELKRQGLVMSSIQNRIDSHKSVVINPYDCCTDVFAAYSEDVLNTYVAKMENLNAG